MIFRARRANNRGTNGSRAPVEPAAWAEPPQTALECVGARLLSYPDRMVVIWRADARIELPVAWCVAAHVSRDGKLVIQFAPHTEPRDPRGCGGLELSLVVSAETLPLAQFIARDLNERGARAGGRARPAPPALRDSGGAVRDGEWVGFRANPDTEAMLAEDRFGRKPHE